MASDMTGEFRNNTKGFLANTGCLVNPVQFATRLQVDSRWKTLPPDVWASIDIAPSGRLANMKVTPAATPTGDVFLPAAENALTYIALPANAERFVTGPLSGCNVYIVRGADGPVVFHVNQNVSKDDKAGNQKAKWEMFMNAAGELKLDPQKAGKVERSWYVDAKDTAGGLVAGCKDASGWVFYFQGLADNGTVKCLEQINV